MKAIVLAIVSLTVSAAMANSPAAPAKTTTSSTTTTTTDAAHAGHDKMADGKMDGTKMEDKCAGKTGKEMETCKMEAKKAHK